MKHLILLLILTLASCSSNNHRPPVYRLGQAVIVHDGFFTGCSGWIHAYRAVSLIQKKPIYYVDLMCPNYMYAYRRGVGFEWIIEERLQPAEGMGVE